MPYRRIVNVLGRILATLGVLLLLFTAYQLWGTGIFEARSQATLRTHLEHELPAGTLQRSAALAHSRSIADAVSHDPAPTTAAPAPGQPVGQIQIPAIGLSQVVVEGIATVDLRMGPGHYPGTPLPGQAGNAAIAGHRTTYGHPFYNLNDLVPGDVVILTTIQGFFEYRVTGQLVVQPTNAAVLAPATTASLTLTTCNPRFSAAQRLVVRAVLARSLLFARVHPAPTTTPPSTTLPAGTKPASPTQTSDLAGGTVTGSWLPALGWGLLSVAAAVAVWLLGRRRRHRWLAYGAGGLVVLVVLFFFFASLSPLLPASF